MKNSESCFLSKCVLYCILIIGQRLQSSLKVRVLSLDKGSQNGGKLSTISLRALESPHITPGKVPTDFRNLFVSLDILLDVTSYFKVLSTRFSWVTAKVKNPSFFNVRQLESFQFYLNNLFC